MEAHSTPTPGAAAAPESLIVVTGLSGSGKSGVNKCLEDMGYFCVDNLPLELVEPLLDQVSTRKRVGIILDVRNPDFAIRFPEILARLRRRHDLRPAEEEDLGGPARHFRIPGAAGSIGIIAPLSCGFCGRCNRIRVTAAGLAKGCLCAEDGIDLRPVLASRRAAGLEDALRRVVGEKPARHRLGFGRPDRGDIHMSRVGG